MKPLLLFIPALILSVSSCHEVEQRKEMVGYTFKLPFVVDTIKNATYLEQNKYKDEASFYPYYIGRLKDTIHLTYPTRYKGKIYKAGSKNLGLPDDSRFFHIFVDTSQIVAFPEGFGVISLSTPSKTGQFEYYWGYPVILLNSSFDTIKSTAGMVINGTIYNTLTALRIEAKDTAGKWKVIERNEVTICGNGLEYMAMAPGELMVVGLPIYKGGTYKTKLRLSLMGYLYSNEFTGYINLTQFRDE